MVSFHVKLQPLIEMSSTSDEPATKRIKTAEDNLMAESDYLTLNFGRGVFRFYVVVPNVPDKPEWNLNGQTIAIEMELTEPVANNISQFKWNLFFVFLLHFIFFSPTKRYPR